MVDVQVPLGRWGRPLRLRWGGVAGHQPIALGPGVQAVAAQHGPHAIGRQPQLAPSWLGQFGGDPGRAEAGVAEGEGHHPLLD
jgi:hypothetical protein